MPSLKELTSRNSLAQPGFTLNRRQALALLATGVASGLAGCSKPVEEILPYVKKPEGIVPGEPLKFATTLPLSGFGRGVVVTSVDGRPIKIEGNPRHPGSLGATDVFAEATVLSLYDPDRSQTVLHEGSIASYQALQQAVVAQLEAIRASDGEGLRLLTGRTTSPTLLRQIDQVLQTFPRARWHAYDPCDSETERSGCRMAFDRPLQIVPRLERAKLVVTLDADPLGHGPDQMRLARGFASHRASSSDSFSRIYTFESVPTITGSKADHRFALPPAIIAEVAVAIAKEQGAAIREPVLSTEMRALIAAVLSDLKAEPGTALVLAGPGMPAETHALVHWINSRLHAPVDYYESLQRTPSGRSSQNLSDLASDLTGGKVSQLVMLGVNPVYDAGDLKIAEVIKRAPFRLHLGCYVDETAALANWHVPQSHVLESWSDIRFVDTTVSLIQPLIRPLYRTLSDHELLAKLIGEPAPKAYDLVRQTWSRQGGSAFDAWWAQALHDGIIESSDAERASIGEPFLSSVPPPSGRSEGIDLVLRPDPSVWDGSFANNAWLQECPKPLTKQVWGNALATHPADAARLGLTSGDVVTITAGDRKLELPVLIEPGIAQGVVSATLGYGRVGAGAIGSGIGANAYAMRTSENRWITSGVSITKTGRRSEILTTQNVVRTAQDVRTLYPIRRASELQDRFSKSEGKPSLMPPQPHIKEGHAWAMVIDASVCIGCNSCVVACQAENNVPVVGPEEVARGRDMHWLRVDAYDHGSTSSPQLGFQPVPCMHCEHPPCEPVCPVAASVHDDDGLNLQVYNRCVGTRFCEANCPYKVRHFNFFGYSDGQEYANLGLESYRAQKNPEVTVRARGVMEKCTYCVQRISAARRAADREERAIESNEVRTACQNACPTEAISFGDLADSDSRLHQQRSDPRHYVLLEHLGTRPRTTYLADTRNPSETIARGSK